MRDPRPAAFTGESAMREAGFWQQVFMRPPAFKPLFFMALLLVGAGGFAAQAADFAPGDYLEDGFLATLRATRSPWASLRDGPSRGNPQGITIRPDGDGLRFDGNFNWHEGCRLFSVAGGGAIRPGESGYCGFDPHRLLRLDRPGHVRIAFGTRRLGYSRVGAIGSMDRFVAVMAVGGRYRDANGGQLVFDARGQVMGLVPAGRFASGGGVGRWCCTRCAVARIRRRSRGRSAGRTMPIRCRCSTRSNGSRRHCGRSGACRVKHRCDLFAAG
jgi:hypothetical protein